MKLHIKPEIARKLVWSRPDSHIIPFCSVCFRHIPDETPLMMWNCEGACVQFCEQCEQTAFAVTEEPYENA